MKKTIFALITNTSLKTKETLISQEELLPEPFIDCRTINGTAKGANYRCEIGGSLYEQFLGQFWQGYYAISVHVSSNLD